VNYRLKKHKEYHENPRAFLTNKKHIAICDNEVTLENALSAAFS